MANPCEDAACELLEYDLSVIPIAAGSKKPPAGFSWKQYQARRAGMEEVEGWFERWPDASIAIVTGRISNLWVLDADTAEGTDWVRQHHKPTAIWQSTPRGGYHALYRIPQGVEVYNSAGELAPGVDVRGEGGYFLVAPSPGYRMHFMEGLEGWEDLAEWAPPLGRPAPAGEGGGNLAGMGNVPTPAYVNQAVPEGGRNNALTRKAGLFVAAGLEPEDVLLACKGWNLEYCKPPLPDAELKRTVNSVLKAHARNHPPVEVNLNLKPEEWTPPSPEMDLPADLLRPKGLLSDLVTYIELASAASTPMFNLAAAITILGSVAGQRVMTETNLRTNFYTFCLGYSGTGKDAPYSALKHLINHTEARPILGPNSPTSASAIFRWMCGMDGARGVTTLFLDEVGLLFGRAKSDRSSLKDIPQCMMEMFTATDRSYVKAFAGADPFELHWHHLSVYGSSTPSRFWESISGGMVLDGFLARCLIFDSRQRAARPRRSVDTALPSLLIHHLNEIWNLPVSRDGGNLEMGGIPRPFMVPKDARAREIFEPFDLEYHEKKNDTRKDESGPSAIYGRAAEHAHKLALIHAVSRYGYFVPDKLVEPEDVEWAMELTRHLVEHTVAQVAENVADSEYERNSKRITKTIRNNRTKERPGLTASQIGRNLHMEAREVERVLGSMVKNEELTVVEYHPDKGRPAQLYCVAGE